MIEEKELPKGWVRTTLGVITVPTRISTHPGNFPDLPFIGMEHVEAETMRLIGTIPASEMKSNALHFWRGDVLYGRLRPYLNKVVRPDFEGLCSSEFLVFRECADIDSLYLQYFLNSWAFKEFASHLNEGDRPRVDWDQLKVFGFPLPPLPEQHRIVAAIEQQFTRLDAGIAALQSARAKLKRYRAAVLKAAVEGKLTETWRAVYPTTEPASLLLERILKERRARWEADLKAKGKDPAKVKYVEPASPDIENLRDLPDKWIWATVEQVCQFVRYGTSAKTSEEASGVPVLRMGNIQDGYLDFNNLKYLPVNHPEFPNLLLENGDLLFNRTNSAELVGKSAVYHGQLDPCSYASYLISVKLTPFCYGDYLGFFLNSSYGRSWAASVVTQQVGQANVNGTKLQALVFPLPPLAEQEQIVSEVERRLSIITQLEVIVAANLKRAERLRQSILREAFAGRLVPQDPTDEPASVLLERIRNERNKHTERNNHNNQKNGINHKSRFSPPSEPVSLDVTHTEQVALWSSNGN